jgi:hypothetical protein
MKSLRIAGIWLLAAIFGTAGLAEPIDPRADSEVLETLPSGAASRAEERRLRRALAEQPRDASLAVKLAQRYLERARGEGDPRFAGLAIAALQPWSGDAAAPGDVVELQATLDQYVHQFDASAARLESLLRREPQRGQAWLTLATVRRVQGHYDASDRACRELLAMNAQPYAAACLAENQGLRGDGNAARRELKRLIAAQGVDADTRNWLGTTLAELEERAGNEAAARAAWQDALRARATPYTMLAYADFLIHHDRHAQALDLLKQEPRNDAVLLRVAIAATRSGARDGERLAREMRDRFAAANLRPDAQTLHGREQAMFALWVDRQPERAFELARANLGLQREPIDLLVLAQAARAIGNESALREARRWQRDVGLRDQRVEALLNGAGS